MCVTPISGISGWHFVTPGNRNVEGIDEILSRVSTEKSPTSTTVRRIHRQPVKMQKRAQLDLRRSYVFFRFAVYAYRLRAIRNLFLAISTSKTSRVSTKIHRHPRRSYHRIRYSSPSNRREPAAAAGLRGCMPRLSSALKKSCSCCPGLELAQVVAPCPGGNNSLCTLNPDLTIGTRDIPDDLCFHGNGDGSRQGVLDAGRGLAECGLDLAAFKGQIAASHAAVDEFEIRAVAKGLRSLD